MTESYSSYVVRTILKYYKKYLGIDIICIIHHDIVNKQVFLTSSRQKLILSMFYC